MTARNFDEQWKERAAAAVGCDSPIRMIDVPTERPIDLRFSVRQMFAVVLFAGIPGVLAVVISFGAGMSGIEVGFIALAVVAPILLVISRSFEPSRAFLTQIVQEKGPQDAILEAMMEPLSMNTNRGTSLMLGAIAAEGHRALLYRFLPSAEIGDIEPIRVPFEPTALDESDPRVADLMNALATEPKSKPISAVKRNLLRAGGWGVVAVFLGNALIQMVRSIMIRQTTPELIWWSVFVVILLCGAGYSLRGITVLAVPGGIVVRELRGLRRKSSVHLYAATRGVLCVYHIRNKLWVISAADEEDQKWTACTPAEARFAMAAWISPIAPPTMAQLSEL